MAQWTVEQDELVLSIKQHLVMLRSLSTYNERFIPSEVLTPFNKTLVAEMSQLCHSVGVDVKDERRNMSLREFTARAKVLVNWILVRRPMVGLVSPILLDSIKKLAELVNAYDKQYDRARARLWWCSFRTEKRFMHM